MYKFLKTKNLLYIEDELSIRENVTELIADYFGTFYVASSAEEGYEVFQDNKIDIIITDIEMDEMSGLDLLEKIRKENNNIHLVVMSAHTKIEYLLEAIPFKLEQYVVKPLTSKKVRELLKTLNDAFSDTNCVKLSAGITLNKVECLFSFEGKCHALTKRELDFLTVLANKSAITYDEIDRLWGHEVPSQNAIRSMIKKLRQKLPDGVLKTRSGLGYYLE